LRGGQERALSMFGKTRLGQGGPERPASGKASEGLPFSHRGGSLVTAVTSGRPNGASRRDRYDRWFRYPAGFSPDTLAAVGQQIGGWSNKTVVDPFCG